MDNLPVIILDRTTGKRRIVPMRWDFPDPQDWKAPPLIRARSEAIDSTQAFALAFHDGQRGIVVVRTFNEAPDVSGPSIQHTITPGDSGAVGIAFLWDQFDFAALPGTLRACVMATVPANS